MEYQKLDSTRQDIRLCKVQPSANFDSRVECILQAFSLQGCPEYVALSYVWGNSTITQEITVNNSIMPVTRNLAAALRRFRERTATTEAQWIWADAICIDQSNILERNQQVKLMTEVYSQSKYTISWLGEEENDSDLAMYTMKYLAEPVSRFEQWGNSRQDPSHAIEQAKAHGIVWQALAEDLDLVPLPAWTAIVTLAKREFWYRVWIAQEIILPKDILICCGSKTLPWISFDQFVRLAAFTVADRASKHNLKTSTLPIQEALGNLTTPWAQRFRAAHGNAQFNSLNEFVWFLGKCSTLRATDPRDRIYGLTALAPDAINVDYSKSLAQAYTDFAALSIESSESLFIVNFAGVDQHLQDDGASSLPSWAPDWRGLDSAFMDVNEPRSAAIWKLQSPRFQSLANTNALVAVGFRCDIVREIQHSSTQYSSSSRDASQPRATLFRELALGITSDGQPRFPEMLQTLMQFDGRILPTGILLPLVAGFLYTCGASAREPTQWEEPLDCPDYMTRYFQLTRETRDGRSDQAIMESLVGKELLGWTGPPNDVHSKRGAEAAYLWETVEKWDTQQQTFFTTTSGRFGLGTRSVEVGDIVCFLATLDRPLVLRKVDEHCVIMGRCYVHGLMHQEVFDDLRVEIAPYELEQYEIW